MLKVPRSELLARVVPALKPNPPISKVDQHRLFSLLKTYIQQDYLYPDFKGLDLVAVADTVTKKIDKGLVADSFYVEMERFMRKLGDKHSYFYSPARAVQDSIAFSGRNEYVGIGVYAQPLPEKKCLSILAVYPGSPAALCGLQQHDKIIAVDNIPIIRDDKVYPLTLGPPCSFSSFTVQSPGKEERELLIARAKVTGGIPVNSRLLPTSDGSRIGYIFLPTFLDMTIFEQVRTKLEEWGPLEGLILDNRMNRGGSGKILSDLLGLFTADTLGYFVSRHKERPFQIKSSPVHNSANVPLVVLTGPRTASYAEVFAGVLQDIGRARIVGQTTAGNVETLYNYRFFDGSVAWIAKESFRSLHAEANWEGKGIKPDVEVIASWGEFSFETDPALPVALKRFQLR